MQVQGKPPAGAKWREWPTRESVLSDFGLTGPQLGALVRHGRLTAYRCPDRSTRFDPSALERAFQVAPTDDAELERDAAPLPSEAPLLAALQNSNTLLLELVREMREERRALLELYFKDPMNQVLIALKDVATSQREENRTLRDGWESAIKAREQLLTQQHERDLLTAMVAAEDQRAEQRQEMLRQYVPQVLARFGAHQSASTVVGLVQDLPSDLYAALLSRLTAEQRAAVEQIRHAPRAAPQPQPATQET